MSTVPSFHVQKRSDYKSPDFTALDIELTFTLADEYTVVRNVAHYKRLTDDRKAPLRLDGEDLELNEVLLNGLNCKSRIEDGQLVIDNVPDEFELTVENVIAPALNSTLMGLYKSGTTYCTQCEPQGFRRITYFLDRPDVSAKYRVTIIAPEYGCGVLLSNGNLVDEGVKNGRRWCTWEDPFPKPSYLFALVAGTFDIIKDTFKTKSGRTVSLELYVDRGAYARGLWAMESIKQAMAWDEKRFNLEYDLDNFKVVAVDFFNQGAMENKSLNIFNSIYVLTDPITGTDSNYYNVQGVIGHEYFHNWTGDRVTLRDWFQLSLKESLTTFRDQEFSSDVSSRALTRLQAVNVIRSVQFAEDAGPMSHPVRPEQVMEMNNFYSVTIYDKGAEVIRMIHTLLGEQLFKKGLALYLERFDGSAATIDDFVACMAEVSGRDFTQFMRWYTQDGTPQVTASWHFDEAAGQLILDLSQHTCATKHQAKKEPFEIPLRTSFLNQAGQTVLPPELGMNGIILLTEKQQRFAFTVPNKDTLPVLLRDFSAPVKLEADYRDAELQHMLAYCDDPFIKHDSALQLIKRYCATNLSRVHAGEELPKPEAICSAFALVLSDNSVDPILVAMMIDIPPLTAMMEFFTDIDIDALSVLRQHLRTEVASVLADRFAEIYRKYYSRAAYRYTHEEAGRRAMCNLALRMQTIALKTQGQVEEADDLVFTHYVNANNLTDRLAAMMAAVHEDLPCAVKIGDDFKREANSDVLLYDNYFRVVATAPLDSTVYNVRKLMRDPHFDKTNPNRVRALIGALVNSNPQAFHKADGTGYVLLADMVQELNTINEQMAAKLLTPLLNYKRLDAKRRALAEETLQKIRALPQVSRSVFEKVEAALGA